MDLFKIFIYDTSFDFMLEILIRCTVMFILVLIFLRISGKRGIRQLSIFELAIILCLGSAAGDPMFVKDVPIIQAFLVMCSIIILYRMTTWLMMKNKRIEKLLEGEPLYIVENGMLVISDVKKEKYSHDEFFAEMRQQHTEHLGQVKYALLETDGCLSILFYSPEDTRWGLPLFPKSYFVATDYEKELFYSCMYCGMTQYLQQLDQVCSRCDHAQWAKSFNCPHA
ncbi:DUF421 domain-containing protein [Acinetobacter puyangensis]|uniref:Uncharacterized membrane protein YcaP, DUF421 family n=1 Tax=Acinetobacter puyangensis TaxID=1096779 RepID=A0A240E5E6_9GAMM|nr:DUF421 domain-containing protein [Acinetobacter puyangensis]SNX43751.1 Uncharacterized membrane protein YcaP, DUF421 family [Acinetobacter puyangensis]